MKKIIQNKDLKNNQYSIGELVENIDNLDLRTILGTQKLTADFCAKYILTTNDYASCVEDTYLDINDVLAQQSHLTRAEIKLAITNLLFE